jgi:hypothetical protein
LYSISLDATLWYGLWIRLDNYGSQFMMHGRRRVTVKEMEIAERTANEWRVTAGPDNPAGPLYASGTFAEADIIGASTVLTVACSACSASRTVECC